MMCPNNPTLPRWLCIEPECKAAELKNRGPQLAGMNSTPIETPWTDPNPPKDWDTKKKHPMMTIDGITYILEYDNLLYSIYGSWKASNGELQY